VIHGSRGRSLPGRFPHRRSNPADPAIVSPIDIANFSDRTIVVTGTAVRTPADASTDSTRDTVTGASSVTVPVDGFGNWSASVPVASGPNRIHAVALNAASRLRQPERITQRALLPGKNARSERFGITGIDARLELGGIESGTGRWHR
jgi:hypothetical protein